MRDPSREVQKKSLVISACLLLLCALWTGNVILSAWRLEIGRNTGFSMSPTLGDGAIYVVRVRPPEIGRGDIVEARIAMDGSVSRVVKRVVDVQEGKVFLEGDNQQATWCGWLPASAVESKVVAVLWRGRPDPSQVALAQTRKPQNQRLMLTN
ncbi:MAG: S24/S26 family peptidase [Abditibacteriales bacterium]|nr:S24/S26 family peptidase [Abditibacteriales bacterium]